LAGALDASMIDALLADAKTTGTPIDGVDGLFNQMTKAVIERALQAEMTHELGYNRDDPAGAGSGNSRNGSGPTRRTGRCWRRRWRLFPYGR
jgi:transposase-like protein